MISQRNPAAGQWCGIYSPLVGLSVVVAVACSVPPPVPGGLGGSRGPGSHETALRTFLSDVDAAVRGWKWEVVQAAFADDARIVFVGPPGNSPQLSLSKQEVLESFKTDAQRPGYKRSRSIRSIEINEERGSATVRSVVSEAYTDEQDRTVSATFLETARIRFDRGRMIIVDYLGEIHRLPRLQETAPEDDF